LLNSGKVELLDNSRLIAQLCGLERRTARSGKDLISHPPGSHDDIATSVAGALLLATNRKAPVVFSEELLAGIASYGRHGQAPAMRMPNRAPQADDDTRPPQSWNPTPVAQFERWQRK
jgi:hypothetical protein